MSEPIDGVPLPSPLLVELFEAERQFFVATQVERLAREALDPYVRRTAEARARKDKAIQAIREAIRADEGQS